jgi:hypothetical protein
MRSISRVEEVSFNAIDKLLQDAAPPASSYTTARFAA